MTMPSEKVEYDCLLLTKESIDNLLNTLEESKILQHLEDMGVSIKPMNPQNNMHCTLRYMAGERNQWKRDYQLCNDALHTSASLCVTTLGVYIKDGVLMNIGAKVDETRTEFEAESLDCIRDNLFTNDINHVTIMVNMNRDENGNRGYAKDTQKCFIELEGNAESGEFSYFMDIEPIYLESTAEAVCGNQILDSMEETKPTLEAEFDDFSL